MGMTADEGFRSGGSIPVPDPTKLTTDAVERASADFDQKLAAQRELLMAEFGRLHDVTIEKFRGVATEFALRDKAVEQAAISNKVNLDAALAAQKEAAAEQQKSNVTAIGKSEEGTKERLNAQGELYSTSIKALEKEVSELRSRLDRGPGEIAATTRTERRLDLGQVLLAASVMISALLLFIALKG
jgi:hypothetical protein